MSENDIATPATALRGPDDKTYHRGDGAEANKVEMTGETGGTEVTGTIAEDDCPDGGYGWIAVICLVLMYAVSWGMSIFSPPLRYPVSRKAI